MQFIDSHAHLNSKELKPFWKSLVTSAKIAGLSHIINIGGDRFDSEWGVQQAEQEPIVYTTVGEHPESLAGHAPDTDTLINNLRRLISSSQKVVGIAEIGLDYTLDPGQAPKQAQIDLITPQLLLAQELDLPVVLHVRDQPGQTQCFDDMINLLKQHTTPNVSAEHQVSSFQNFNVPVIPAEAGIRDPRILKQVQDDDSPAATANRKLQTANNDSTPSHPRPLSGIFHCWTGTPEQLQTALQIPDFYISFSGILTYKSAGHITEAATLVPDNRLLIETDSPYLMPEPRRSLIRKDKTQFSLCQPRDVIMTAQKLADLRGHTLEQIAQITSANAKTVFRLP